MRVKGSTELARMLLLQRQSIDARAVLDRAGQEMSTGLKADKFRATGGNLARLYTIERMLERNAAHQHVINLTGMRVDMMQAGLGQAQVAAEAITVDMLSAVGRADVGSARVHAAHAERSFDQLVATLNGQVAGQSLYAGIATDGPALRPAAEILAEIGTLVAGLTPADAVAAIEDYFAGTGTPNFLADAYLGSTTGLVAAEIGDGMRLDYALTALEPEIVATLRGFAMAAMVNSGPFAGASNEDQLALLNAAGATLLAAKEGLLGLRARVGAAQEAVEVAQARRNAEREGYEMARVRIVGADPFEAATVFQAMETQLQNVFTVTARLTALRFANFMR